MPVTRLEEIKATFSRFGRPYEDDIIWLISELKTAHATIERAREVATFYSVPGNVYGMTETFLEVDRTAPQFISCRAGMRAREFLATLERPVEEHPLCPTYINCINCQWRRERKDG
jgi:hypothetical protein